MGQCRPCPTAPVVEGAAGKQKPCASELIEESQTTKRATLVSWSLNYKLAQSYGINVNNSGIGRDNLHVKE